MATKLTPDSKRTDLYLVNPSEIVVKPDLRGRYTPPTRAQVVALALSILEHGQQQAVQVRRVADTVQLNMGFTRHEAVSLIREGFEHEGVFHHDPDFMLKVTVVNANDEAAFIHNIVENAHRNQTSAIDDAHNQERLRDRYGKSNEEIAKLYRVSVPQVVRLQKLLGLSKEHQAMVHEGTLPVQAALDLLELPENERDATVKASTKEGGKVKGTEVRAQVRQRVIDSGSGKAKGRTSKELINCFAAKAALGGDQAKLAQAIIDYTQGRISDEDFDALWDETFLLPVR